MTKAAPDRTAPVLRRSRWPGWIWAVPIAAAGVVAWLGIRDLLSRGPEVTVTFMHSEGIAADNTQVRYRDMQVGKVADVALAKDLSHVVVTLRLRAEMADTLKQGTRFWIVGPSVGGGLASLATLVSGAYIEMDPGGGKPQRHFVGLEHPVHVEGGPGTRYVLHAGALGPLGPGAAIQYLGLDVGAVEEAQLRRDGAGFDVAAFIRAPYDKLVHPGSRFWTTGDVTLDRRRRQGASRLARLAAFRRHHLRYAACRSLGAAEPRRCRVRALFQRRRRQRRRTR